MEKKWKIGPSGEGFKYCFTTFLIQDKIQNFQFIPTSLGYIFRAYTRFQSWERVAEYWIHLLLQRKNNILNIFIPREIKGLQLHAMDKNPFITKKKPMVAIHLKASST